MAVEVGHKKMCRTANDMKLLSLGIETLPFRDGMPL